MCNTQYNIKYNEIVPKFATVVSASPVHSQTNSPYILEGTEAFTLVITFLLHYDYIFPEIKNFHYTEIFIRSAFMSISILPQLIVTLTDFKSQDFNHYASVNYICISYIFSTEIIIIDGVSVTQHNICTFVVL